MIQWLKRRLSSDEEPEDPGPPEPSEGEREWTLTVYSATVEYRNGDTETFECYGKYTRGDTVGFNVSLDWYTYNDHVSRKYQRRTEHYEVLDREPELEELRDETWRVSWRTEWSQNFRGLWEESVDRDSVELERVA